MKIENFGAEMNSAGGGRPRGIKVINESPVELADNFSSAASRSACGIYQKMSCNYAGCGCPDHHLDNSGCGGPVYDGCGGPVYDGCGGPVYDGCGGPVYNGCGYADHHLDNSGCGGPVYNGCGYADHHLDHSGCGWQISQGNYCGCGGSTWRGWPIPSGC